MHQVQRMCLQNSCSPRTEPVLHRTEGKPVGCGSSGFTVMGCYFSQDFIDFCEKSNSDLNKSIWFPPKQTNKHVVFTKLAKLALPPRLKGAFYTSTPPPRWSPFPYCLASWAAFSLTLCPSLGWPSGTLLMTPRSCLWTKAMGCSSDYRAAQLWRR